VRSTIRTMAKCAFYAVRKGRTPGIYKTWDECKHQTDGFSGAEYKKFKTATEAQGFIKKNNGKENHGTGAGISCSKLIDKLPTHKTITSKWGAAGDSSKASIVNENERIAQQYMEHYNRISGVDEVPRGVSTSNSSSTPIAKAVTGPNGTVSYNDAFGSDKDFIPIGSQTEVDSDAESSSLSSKKLRQHKDKKQVYYGIVYKDGKTKIVKSWTECDKFTKGIQGVTFKKFKKLQDAEAFVNQSSTEFPPLSPDSRESMIKSFLSNNSKVLMEEQKSLKPQVIFCDGSFIPSKDGPSKDKAGYGIYFGPDDPRNKSVPLTQDPKSSYISEVKATAAVLRQIASEIDLYIDEKWDLFPKYTILTDSETVKNILGKYSGSWTEQDYAKRSDVPELKQMVKDYKKIKNFYHTYSPIFNDHVFEIKWVKGHVGIKGNVEADRLARKGAGKSVL